LSRLRASFKNKTDAHPPAPLCSTTSRLLHASRILSKCWSNSCLSTPKRAAAVIKFALAAKVATWDVGANYKDILNGVVLRNRRIVFLTTRGSRRACKPSTHLQLLHPLSELRTYTWPACKRIGQPGCRSIDQCLAG